MKRSHQELLNTDINIQTNDSEHEREKENDFELIPKVKVKQDKDNQGGIKTFCRIRPSTTAKNGNKHFLLKSFTLFT